MAGHDCCLSDQLLNRCFNFPWAVRREIFADRKDNVCCRKNKITVLPVKFSDDSFDPVSSDCAFNAVNADTQSVSGSAVGQENQTEILAPQALPRAVDPVVIIRFGEQA